MGLGFFELAPEWLKRLTPALTSAGLVVLIGSMGVQIGGDPLLLSQIWLLGFKALILALATVGGSILAVYLALPLLPAGFSSNGPQSRGSSTLTILVIISIAGGVILGYAVVPAGWLNYSSALTSCALSVMMLAVGLDLGSNKEAWLGMRKLGWKVFYLPLSVVLGTLLAAGGASFLLRMPLNEASAIGAGFGWYSLAGVLLTELYNVETGTISFLANIFRELLAVVLIPVLYRWKPGLLCIAPGGATTMDTTLPLVAKAAGPGAALIAFTSGVTLTILVPVLVPLLIKLS